ncbi:MAG: response regulator transcription factor [Armatimonadota bacterium]|nr:MAG: response regulator transcription factor [Armatimonadota bacterium]
MSLRVLVISSDPARAGRLHDDVTRVGGDVAHLGPDELEDRAEHVRLPHVIFFDLGDAGVAETELCAAIKGIRRLREVPVLAVVPEQRLPSFNSCADIDDFVSAPYRDAELRARLLRLAARADGAVSATVIRSGDLALDPDSYDVKVRGVRVDLTLKEYELLKSLVTRPGRVFTRDQILNSVWGYDYVGGTRTVDVHIRRLRAKLGDVGRRSIDTIRGVGYAFRPPRTQAAETEPPRVARSAPPRGTG